MSHATAFAAGEATRATTLWGFDSSYLLSFSFAVSRWLFKPTMQVPKRPFAFSLFLVSPRGAASSSSSFLPASRIRFFCSALSVSSSSSRSGDCNENHYLLKSSRRRRGFSWIRALLHYCWIDLNSTDFVFLDLQRCLLLMLLVAFAIFD